MDRRHAPRPSLAHAREAADGLLLRKVTDGEMTVDAAAGMAATGFTVATRVLADLRRQGVSAERITDSFRRKVEQAKAAGDNRAVLAGEFTLAVWDGMQADLAAYLRGTEARKA